MPPSRRRVLRTGSVLLAGSLAGCVSGALETRESEDGTATSDSNPTTHALGVDTSIPGDSGPEATAEFPDGPKSPPERPANLTAESVRRYVRTFERRWVYNLVSSGEPTDIQQKCGVDSVAERGGGFRVVVWCSASATTESDGKTVHADYFRQYATYFVRSDSTVRRDGNSKTRR